MTKKLLIDGVYPEETRVALVDEKNRLLEYDFSSIAKETVKGNIYLAKIMRVEPSLQAAFVEYGGNRHGFLAFSEIHPDYFRIPVSDREALSAQLYDQTYPLDDDIEEPTESEGSDGSEDAEGLEKEEGDGGPGDETVEFENSVSTISGESIEHVNADDEEDRVHAKRPQLHRMYKIQEVIHKNQILLIQVVKEERGQKGAALTTYLSLAGRYCVLMPNSPHAGGISRKIASSTDRKRLKSVLEGLEIPREMGLIIRTAGKDRTKVEIKRDTDYLMRQWEEIRQETLKSMAPALIYQEDTIIRRSIRDLYSKDVGQIIVDGEESYKTAKDFMKRLMPSHSKDVIQHKDTVVPLFTTYRIEKQLEMMYAPVVPLPSGGSIVLHPTEALVSIDINSGRATRERHITGTALNTNLEAAVEIARQVRMRDLAGLIVIDFIDMEDRRHVQQVERKVREAFKEDRARVQMSKISPFGLLELSRQRIRPSILETSSIPCAHCQSTGYVRSTESMGLQILRVLEEEGFAGRSAKIKVQVPFAVAWYLLNDKRRVLTDFETRHGMQVEVEAQESLVIPDYRILQVERKGGGSGSSARDIEVVEEVSNDDNKNRRVKGRRTPNSSDVEGTSNDRRSNNQRNDRRGSQKSTQKPAVNDDDVAPNFEKAEGAVAASTDGGEGDGQKRRKRNRNNRRRGRNRTDRPQAEGLEKNPESIGESDNEPNGNVIPKEPVDVDGNRDSVEPKDNKSRSRGRTRHPSTRGRNRSDKIKGDGNSSDSDAGNASGNKAALDQSSGATVPKAAEKSDAKASETSTSAAETKSSEGTPKKTRKPKSWLKRLLE